MRVAQLNDCSACSTARAQSVIDAGVPEDDYGHVEEWRTWPGYTERQRLAIEYAERFTVDHQGIDDELFDRMHAHTPTPRSSTSRCASRSGSGSGVRSRCSTSSSAPASSPTSSPEAVLRGSTTRTPPGPRGSRGRPPRSRRRSRA